LASLKDIAREHRETGKLIPKPILARLTPAEAAYRARRANEVRESAEHANGETRTALLSHSRALLRALPLPEYLAQRQKYKELEAGAPSTLDANGQSPAGAFHQACAELAERNVYARGLAEAAGKRLSGQGHQFFDGCDLDAVLGLQASNGEDVTDASKGVTHDFLTKRASAKVGQADIVKRVGAETNKRLTCITAELAKAQKQTEDELRELAADISAYKRAQNAEAAKRGMPMPFRDEALQADRDRIAELRNYASHLAGLSKDTNLDSEVRAHYARKFSETEKELAELVRKTEGM
jgi:hypothetical protein